MIAMSQQEKEDRVFACSFSMAKYISTSSAAMHVEFLEEPLLVESDCKDLHEKCKIVIMLLNLASFVKIFLPS